MNSYDLPYWAYIILIPVVIWALFWKGLALWHAAKRGNKIWFVVLFLINTIGILDIIYLIIAGKLKIGALFDATDQVASSPDQK